MPIFEFVNPDDPAARSKAKSHVARKAHREKRLREIESYRSRVDQAPRSVQSPGHALSAVSAGALMKLPTRPQLDDERTRLRDGGVQTASPSSESAPGSDGDTAITEYSDEQPSSDPPTWLDTYASRIAARPHHSFWMAYSQLDAGDRSLLEWCQLSSRSAVDRVMLICKYNRPCQSA
jgi:hypothetical protein